MADLRTLKTSISLMEHRDALELILEMRKRRRNFQKPKPKKKAARPRKTVQKLDEKQILELLAALED